MSDRSDVAEHLLKEWGEEGVRLVKTSEVVMGGLVESSCGRAHDVHRIRTDTRSRVPTFGKFFLPDRRTFIPSSGGHDPAHVGHLPGDGEAAPERRAEARRRGSHESPGLLGTNSATGFMEMAVRNGIRRRALSLVNGAFSERFAGIVGACGKECIRLDVPLGAASNPTCCATR